MKKPAKSTPPKFKPCNLGGCIAGLVRKPRHDGTGLFKMVECSCMLTWRAQKGVAKPDGKAAGANA